MEKQTNDERFEVCTKAIRAGKRTYYFDVKKTRNDDYYLTITESKRKADDGDNSKSFEKHKIFLYREDFEKFATSLRDAIDFVVAAQGEYQPRTYESVPEVEKQSADIKIDIDF